ncbi:glycosyltransferase family 4 protein [Neisseria montereyensis]|uniref:Glycosyltransferase family 4 protein n=1 Tax=Neisseria montereyensis TaxID=2973938 RepID=A0ABT2FF64_9NEIS|nr:glycosyltransferase family 4 protein [Neisseria montereyensis]MCS4534150.1 glycosyltransferase family 4 protein [Neisseria montereyensis]
MTENIAISINRFSRGGGMESYTFDLVRAFSAQNHRIRIYATKFDTTLPEYAQIDPQLINQKHTPKKLRPFFFTHQLQKCRLANERLIACNPSDHADIFICGGTHLGHVNNMAPQTNLMKRLLDRFIIHRNRTNYRTAKSIMAHSALMARELNELYGVPSEKIHVVYPPADTERFSPASPEEIAAIRARYGFKDYETVFLFPSTGHKRKGFDMLADFFTQTDLPVKLAVAGSPLPRPMKNIIELGFCKNMPELYRAADYTIMASLYEPFGLVGVESLLSGTRVVLADNIGSVEVMNDKAGFFFSRTNPETLADAIQKAVALKESDKHKLTNPTEALTYNPSLQAHFIALQAMLEAV